MATYDAIATVSGNGSSNIVTFSSIPQTYKDLRIVWSTWSEPSRTAMSIRFNGNTSTNLWSVDMWQESSSVDKYRSATAGRGNVGYQCVPNTNKLSMGIIDIPGYQITSATHSVVAIACAPTDSAAVVAQHCVYFDSFDQITSISLFPSGLANLSSNFRATLFGLGS